MKHIRFLEQKKIHFDEREIVKTAVEDLQIEKPLKEI